MNVTWNKDFILPVRYSETSIGRVPWLENEGSHQIWRGGPINYGNKGSWTNRNGNKMGHNLILESCRPYP